MNTTTTTRLALGAAVTALALGFAACGTETADDLATSPGRAAPRTESRISPRTAEHRAELERQARRERAEHADAQRWARGHESAEHPPGSFHADTYCRAGAHTTHRVITCS